MIETLKNFIERTLKCRIYRNSLPRGTDLFFDINRQYDITTFKNIFDIGANIGITTNLYLKNFTMATIYSFEPVASTFAQLRTNVDDPTKRVRLFQRAMGAQPGSAKINLTGDHQTSSIIHNKTGKTETIDVDSLDNFVHEHSIGHIDFLKIDTEGYEKNVLAGAKQLLSNHHIGMLYLECEPLKTDKPFVAYADVAELLGGYGYRLFGIYEQQPCWDGGKHVLFCNPVFINPELQKASS